MRQLIDIVQDAGSDKHTVFGGTWTGGYLLQQEPTEITALLELLKSRGPFENYLSIGIAAGGTERLICENVQVDSLTVMDDGLHHNHFFWEENKRNLPIFREFIGDSHSMKAKVFLKELGRQFDLVGIDGDHTYEGVTQDWQMVKPYLKDGALVWFHDIFCEYERLKNQPDTWKIFRGLTEGTRRFWPEISKQYPVVLEAGNEIGIGVIRYHHGPGYPGMQSS